MLTSELTVHMLKCIVRGHLCCPLIHDYSFIHSTTFVNNTCKGFMKETKKLNWGVRQICLSLGKQLLHWSHKKKHSFYQVRGEKKLKYQLSLKRRTLTYSYSLYTVTHFTTLTYCTDTNLAVQNDSNKSCFKECSELKLHLWLASNVKASHLLLHMTFSNAKETDSRNKVHFIGRSRTAYNDNRLAFYSYK